jgi:molybdopterin-guanine dinucleotide biosynthesis protein A
MDGFLLAGGKSSRMGCNKALLVAGGVPLIQRVADALSVVADRVTVIANLPEDYRFLGLPILGDAVAGVGPLGGITTALRATQSEVCLVLACDLPLVRPDLLRALIREARGADAAVPRTQDGDHPLCAVYARTGLAQAEAQIEAGDYKVTRFLERIRTRWVGPETWGKADPDGLSFVNVNTPEMYEKVKEMVLRR